MNGMPSNTYSWNNGATTPTIANLSNGNYKCTISDANGYFLTTPNYTIAGPPNIVIQILNLQNNLCGGAGQGLIEINGTGGNGGFSYFWNTGSGSNLINNLYAGVYSVTVTDNQGCQKYASYTITEPPALTATSTQTNPTCGMSNGSATLQPLGGASPYTYEMNGTTQSNPLFTNLSGGVYPYTVFDNNGCLFTSNVTLTSSMLPTAITSTNGDVSCINLTAQVNGTGSSTGSNFTYLWTTTDGVIESGATSLIATVSEGGTYNLLVTNTSNTCTKSSTAVVVSNNTKPILVIANPDELDCVTSEVVINGSSSSAGSNFIYAWTTTNGNIVSGENSLNPTVDEVGDYTLLITNTSNGCTKQGATAVIENILVPSLSIPEATITCEDSEVELCAVTNATAVLWNVMNNNTNNCILVDIGGTYSVTATGVNGCTATLSSIVTEEVDLPQITVSVPDVLTCLIETVSLNGQVEGDATEFTFNWTTTDGVINSGANTLEPIVSKAGTYTFEAINIVSGCSSQVSVDLTEIETAPSSDYTGALTASGFNGMATATASTNEYLWDFGNGITSTSANASTVYSASGVYNVCLTVSNDCGENETCQEYTFSLAMSVTSVIGNVSCASGNNGKIELIVAGGLSPFTFAWAGPDGYTSDKILITNLGVGVYSVVVNDAASNMFCQTYTITAPQPLASTNPIVTHDINNQGQGSIDISVSGGVSPYTYNWSNGATTQDVSNLKSGEYLCLVTDNNGCEKSFGPFEVSNTSSVEEAKYIANFEIYPNPANELINYNIQFLNSTTTKVKIINNLGSIVYVKSYDTHVNDKFDVSNLSAGIYFISVSNENFNIVKRFVVIK
jgi:hypothetical protein